MNTIFAHTATATAAYYAPYLDPDKTGEAPGQWWGRQAAVLGLTGNVTTEDLEALLTGHDPITGQLLGSPLEDKVNKHGGLVRAVAGFDCTFSAPKSVSTLWALTGDERIRNAHNMAAQVVLDHAERHGCVVRPRVGGGRRQFLDGHGLIIAVFPQSTSREDDPQLHTHALISTKVQAPNDRWYALDAKWLKTYQRALGGLYQQVLRAELTRLFGFAWTDLHEAQAEIAHMPPELLEAFSKRTAQVESRTAELVDGFREREGREPTRPERASLQRAAAKDSRRNKSDLPVAEAATGWIAEAEARGWTGDALMAHVRGKRPIEPETIDVEHVLNIASTKSSTWTRTDILKAICDLARPPADIGGAEWARCLEATADRVVAQHVNLDPAGIDGPVRASDGRSVWLQPYKNHLSHDLVLAQEDRILSFALEAQQPEPDPSRTVDVEGLDVLQADAARAVAGHDRLTLIVGPAGTGKTTTLERAVADLRDQGRRSFGIAPTKKATRVIAKEANLPSLTIAQLLFEYDRPTGPHVPWNLPEGTTLVVDEAGMAGTGDLDRIISLAQSHRWRLVLVGDPRQLQAVGRGGMFNELVRISRTHELATIHRFTHDWERTASLDLRHGRASALDAYQDHDRITPGNLADHLESIADAWIRHNHAGERVAITAETNREVDALNAAIQSRRRGWELDEVCVAPVAGGETAGVGDIIQTRDNNLRLVTTAGDTVANRDTWQVDDVPGDGSLVVSRIHGQGTVTLPVDYVRTQVRLGYATTAYGHQGDTVDVSYTLVSTSSTHQGLYVGATRGRTDNHFMVVTDEPDLAYARDVLDYALTRDRADVPAIVQRRELAAQAAPGVPTAARRTEVEVDDLEARERRVKELTGRIIQLNGPFVDAEEALEAARADYERAQSRLAYLKHQQENARFWKRSHFDEPIAEARAAVAAAKAPAEEAKAALTSIRDERAEIVAERDRLEKALSLERTQLQLADSPRRPAERAREPVSRGGLGM